MKNEAKIGITVLLAILVAIVGFRFMRDVPIFRQTLEVSAVFDRGDGINRGSLVNLKGVKVGSVSRVNLTPDNRVRVTMQLNEDLRIPVNSEAHLTSLGIVEGKSIVLHLGDSENIVQYGGEIEGVYIEGVTEVLGSKGEELAGDVSASLSQLNQFLQQLNKTLDDDTRQSVDQTLKNADSAMQTIAETLEKNKQDIDQAISSASRTMMQLDTLATDNRPRVDSLLASLEENVNELHKVRTELETASVNLNQILEKINSGEGTMGRLVNDPSLYENLDQLSKEMNELVKGINEDPGRYLKHMSIIEIF
ncbi:MlaD family protein [Rhodohalobacter halophilus]|uniref:MlaD family protein n=1 Tax=Rhodohalobacter halophilus TaxID=1812810 RepID=UPI00159F1291|nr:MlaD family protein [Rhodohalobacter halophilus]